MSWRGRRRVQDMQADGVEPMDGLATQYAMPLDAHFVLSRVYRYSSFVFQVNSRMNGYAKVGDAGRGFRSGGRKKRLASGENIKAGE